MSHEGRDTYVARTASDWPLEVGPALSAARLHLQQDKTSTLTTNEEVLIPMQQKRWVEGSQTTSNVTWTYKVDRTSPGRLYILLLEQRPIVLRQHLASN